jgi:hypothetical protein
MGPGKSRVLLSFEDYRSLNPMRSNIPDFGYPHPKDWFSPFWALPDFRDGKNGLLQVFFSYTPAKNTSNSIRQYVCRRFQLRTLYRTGICDGFAMSF